MNPRQSTMKRSIKKKKSQSQYEKANIILYNVKQEIQGIKPDQSLSSGDRI